MLAGLTDLRPRGFTLLELLVVLAIIGILAGVVAINFVGADRERDLQTEAVRLAALLELARNEALTRNTPWGLFVANSAYDFASFDFESGKWTRPEHGPFRAREAPPGISFSAHTEPAASPASGSGRTPPIAGPAPPDILIFASGEQTPFTIEVLPAWDSPPWLVQSDGIQRTVASRAGEDSP